MYSKGEPMILVTGATGHIGNVLVRQLVERGEAVRALVLPGEDLTPLGGLPLEIVEGDVLDPDSLKQAMQGIHAIYHLAGIITIMPGQDELVHRVNVEGTRNVLRTAARAGIRRLVYTSSIHALNRAPHGVVIDESIPFDPQHAISAYDRSKAEASLLVQDAACLGLDAVIVCPTGVIGPYDFRGSEMGEVIRHATQRGLTFLIDGAYDFVDVRDVAEGLIQAATLGRTGEAYILSGERITIAGIIEEVQRATGLHNIRLAVPISLVRLAAMIAPLYYRLARTRPALTPYSLATVTSNSVISSAKARAELGYTPRSLSVSIQDTVAWLAERRLKLPTTRRKKAV
jgi:dihydroflavonol-4-reductase